MRRPDMKTDELILDSLSKLGIDISIDDGDMHSNRIAVIADELARFAEESADTIYKKRLHNSKLVEPVYFSDYIDKPDRGLDIDFLTELHTLEFMKKRSHLVIWGNPGTGKSWLADSLATTACKAGKRVRKVDFQPFCRELASYKLANDAEALERKLKYYSRFDLLVIDEFLNYDLDDAYLLQELFKRIEDLRLCTLIVCCQTEPSNWPKLFKVKSFGESVRGRILKGGKILHTQGCDMRLL